MERRTRIRWDRLGRWALIVVLGFVLYLYVGPAATWVSTYGEAGRKRADVAALKAENQRLRERRQRAQDPAALEREARAWAWSRRREVLRGRGTASPRTSLK